MGGLILGLVTTVLLPFAILAIWGVGLSLALWRTGLRPRIQLSSLRPWWPMILLILLIHLLTTLEAAPLGRPSWSGLLAGVQALLRVGCTIGWLVVYSRSTAQDDLVAGVGWWLQPLGRLGLPVADLGLSLAVAMGTVPVVLGEGRRISASLRLRRSGPVGLGERRPRRHLRGTLEALEDRARVIVPLLEAMSRRAETLSLSLRSRRPGSLMAGQPGPGVLGLALLLLWLMALVAWTILPGGAP
jgi:energy-coupling factor transporter transmembrane protein EcfT